MFKTIKDLITVSCVYVLCVICFVGSTAWAQYDAEQLIRAAARNDVHRIVVSSFFTNGSTADSFTKGVRSEIMTALARGNTGLNIVDCKSSESLAAESTFQGTALADSQSADAILVGDVLCDVSCKTAICHLRLISLIDSRILAATYTEVPYPSKRSIENRPLPSVTPLKAPDYTNVRKVRIAVADMGNVTFSNTLENRMAIDYAVAEMVRSNLKLYEREFYFLTIEEVKMRGSSIGNGNPQAVMVGDFPAGTKKTIRVIAVKDSSILMDMEVSVGSGKSASSPGSETDASKNAVNDFSEENAQQAQPCVQYKWSDSGYTLECRMDISKYMTLDENTLYKLTHLPSSGGDNTILPSRKWECPIKISDTTWLGSFGIRGEASPRYPAFEEYKYDGDYMLREVYSRILRCTGGNKAAANIVFMGALFRGFELDGKPFPGFLTLVNAELYSRWTTNSTGKQDAFLDLFTCHLLELFQDHSTLPVSHFKRVVYCDDYPSGRYTYGDSSIKYTFSIRKEGGIPSSVSVRISLKPMKTKLYKVEAQQQIINL